MQQSFFESFRCALKGIALAWKGERNFRIEIGLGIIVTAAGVYFGISSGEWLVLILTVTLVLSVEALNTALEEICDKFSPEHDPHIGRIKDLAAAAVLIVSLGALFVGCTIFWPYIALLF